MCFKIISIIKNEWRLKYVAYTMVLFRVWEVHQDCPDKEDRQAARVIGEIPDPGVKEVHPEEQVPADLPDLKVHRVYQEDR